MNHYTICWYNHQYIIVRVFVKKKHNIISYIYIYILTISSYFFLTYHHYFPTTHRIHVYAIYGNIYHQYIPNVSIYTIHGSYGIINHDTQTQPRFSQPQTTAAVATSKRRKSCLGRRAERAERPAKRWGPQFLVVYDIILYIYVHIYIQIHIWHIYIYMP